MCVAFGCTLFGNLFSTFAVLRTQHRCARVAGNTVARAAERPVACGRGGIDGEAARPRIQQQLAPRLFAFSLAVLDSDEFLLPVGRRAHQHQDALAGIGGVLERDV